MLVPPRFALAGQPRRLSPHGQYTELVMNNKPKLMGLGVALGALLGAVFGVFAGHIAIWLGMGLAMGMAIGATMRAKEPECPECAALHRAHEARRQ